MRRRRTCRGQMPPNYLFHCGTREFNKQKKAGHQLLRVFYVVKDINIYKMKRNSVFYERVMNSNPYILKNKWPKELLKNEVFVRLLG